MKFIRYSLFKGVLSLVALVFCILCSSISSAQSVEKPLVIAMSSDFRPFTFVNAEGDPAGMFVDLWRLWSQKTGRPITFLISDWPTSVDNVKSGKADVHSGMVHSPHRTEWLAPLPSIYPTDIRYFQPRSHPPLKDLAELAGGTVAVIRGGVPEEFLRTNYPKTHLLSVNTRDELLTVTRTGQADGFVLVAPVAVSLIDSQGLSGEFDKNGILLYSEEFSPGVLKDKVELAAEVRHGFEVIASRELAGIEAAWIEDPAKRKISSIFRLLSNEERSWVRAHPIIRVGMSPVLPPLKFSEGGVIKGVEPDYLHELSEQTGLKFELVVGPFNEMDAKVKAGELDMFLSFYVPARLEFMNFTDSFMDFKPLLIGRTNTSYIGSLASLGGKRVATIKGVKLHEKTLAPYPDIQVVPCDTMDDMFQAVATGRADVLLSKTLFAGYMLNHYPQLKIVGVLDLPPDPYLYAVRKDYPELVDILNKGIASIPGERVDAIVQKWFTLQVEYRPQMNEILRWVSYAVVLCFVFGGGISLFFWNRQLRRRIDLKTAELQSEVELRQAGEEFQRTLIRSAIDGFWLLDSGGRLLQVNEAYCRMSGYSESELLSMSIADLEVCESAAETKEHLTRVKAGEGSCFESRHRHKNGTFFDVEVSCQFRPEAGGLFFGFLRDVTERKQAEGKRLRRQQQDLLRLNEIIELSGMSNESDQIVYDRILNGLVRLSESQYGYIYFYDEATELFTLHAWSEQVSADCSVLDPQTTYSLKKTGFWGEVVRQRRTIINNDFPDPHSLKKGYPEGHAQLSRFMSVPIFSGDLIVAVAGVANKVEPYVDEDAYALQDFCQGAWNVIRQRQEHRRFLEEQAQYRRLFEKMSTPCALHELLFDNEGRPCDYRFLLVNQGMAELIGQSRDEIIGRTACEIYGSMDPPLLERFTAVSLQGKDDEFEYCIAESDRYLIIRCYSPQKNQFVTITTDVTAERQLLKKELSDEITSRERERLSRDLHDGVAQTLQTIRLYLNLLKDGKVPEDEITQMATQLDAEVAEAYIELREISHQLRPEYLQKYNLDGAIRNRCMRLKKRGVPITDIYQGEFASLSLEVSENLYRIFQEALTNAIRHSGASQIEVCLQGVDSWVLLRIIDDGQGMKDALEGVGIKSMQERAKLIGAHLSVKSPASGTCVSVEWRRNDPDYIG